MSRKIHRHALMGLLLLASVASTLPGQADPVLPGGGQGPPKPVRSTGGTWALSFEDEFEGFELDSRKWSNGYGWGNASASTRAYCDPANSIVVDGILVQQARKVPQEGKPFSGACINTRHKFSQLYGYWEIRMRTAGGRGFYNAFWAKPDSGSWPPEIDVVEAPGGIPNRVTHTVHWHDGVAPRKSNSRFFGPDFSKGFHTFGVQWSPKGSIWYVDGVETFRTSDGASHMGGNGPFYAILVLQVSQISPYFPPVDATTPWPGHQYVDYVRVWKRPAPPPKPAPAPQPSGRRPAASPPPSDNSA
jgi:beta-glucanase (GH16 family)